jgi:hypothetical protein
VTGTRVRDLGCSLKVYRRALTDELRLYGEMHRFIAVLVENLGARTAEVDVNHRPRTAGRSKYGLGRTLKVMLDLITVWFMDGYQTKPIYVFGGIGAALGSASLALAAFVLYQKFEFGVWVHRNPLFVLSTVMSVVAVQFLCLGLIAEILVRTYFESQQKPTYLLATPRPAAAVAEAAKAALSKSPVAPMNAPLARGQVPASTESLGFPERGVLPAAAAGRVTGGHA